MTMTTYDPGSRVDLAPAAVLFRSLADPRRLAIVLELARGERRVVDLTRTLGLAQSTVSAHVACLAGCGLVDARLVGRQSFYRLTQPALFAVLASAEQLLTDTGNAVALCPARPATDLADIAGAAIKEALAEGPLAVAGVGQQ